MTEKSFCWCEANKNSISTKNNRNRKNFSLREVLLIENFYCTCNRVMWSVFICEYFHSKNMGRYIGGEFLKLLSIFWVGRFFFFLFFFYFYKQVGRYFNVKIGIYLGETFYFVGLFLLFLSIYYFNLISFVLS